MSRRMQISALMISPDRGIASQFREAAARGRAIEIAAELNAYPTESALDARVRQLRPDVLLLDVASGLETAGELIRFATAMKPPVPVIALHSRNDSQAILKSLRDGASEFLFAPFDVSIQEAAANRIQKLLEAGQGAPQDRGRLVVFTSAKPGSGASTLAIQTAYALRRGAARRVLLADFDVYGGSIGFYLGLDASASIVDLLGTPGRVDPEQWPSVIATAQGIDVLPAPPLAYTEPLDAAKLHEIFEFARNGYDWIVADLPGVFHRATLVCIAESDRAFLVSTADLASLHLTRRAVKLLNQLAFDGSKYQVLVNRLESRTELNSSDLSKLFECPVDKGLPNDRLALERVLTLGRPLDGSSELGRAVEGLAAKLVGALPEPKRPAGLMHPRPAFSQT